MKSFLFALSVILLDVAGCGVFGGGGGNNYIFLDVDTKFINLPWQQGSTCELQVTSNGSWSVSVRDPWLEVSPLSKAQHTTTVTVKAATSNEVSHERFSTITIVGEDEREEITVCQRGKDGNTD